MRTEESVELALLSCDKLLSPDDLVRLLAVHDPDRLMPRFWANIDCGAPMIVDAATLTFLGYAGTVRIQKQNFRMVLHRENILYTAVDVGKWPEIKQEIYEAMYAVVKKLQWVVLSGSNFKRACLFAQTPRSRIVADFYIELEVAWRQYTRYVTSFKERANRYAYEQQLDSGCSRMGAGERVIVYAGICRYQRWVMSDR